MAQLTWRNVDAPNFAPVAALQAQAGDAFSRAVGGLKTGVAAFEAAKSTDANQAIAARALAIQDPIAYQKALADGTLLGGVDPSTVSPEMMASLQGGIATRLGQTRSGISNEASQEALAFDRAVNPLKIQDTKDDLTLNGQRIDSGKLSNQSAQFTFDNTVRGDTQRRAAEGALDALRSKYGDAGSATEAFYKDDAFKGLDPEVRNAVVGRIGGLFGDAGGLAGSVPGAAGGGAGMTAAGGDASRVMNYQARGAGFNAVPADVNTLGKASDFATSVNRAGVPSSAMGTFQITGQTLRDFAPTVFGSNWQTVPFNAENQEKLAKAIFESRKGGNLASTWTSLPNSVPGAYKDITWDRMRQIIASGESGANLANMGISTAQNQAAQFDSAAANALGTQGGMSGLSTQRANAFMGAVNNASQTTADVVTGMTAKGTQFEKMDKGALSDRINDLANKYQVAPSVAAWAIGQSAVKNSLWNKVQNPFTTTWNFGGDFAVDTGKASALIEYARNNNGSGMLNQAATVQNQGLLAQQQQAAQGALAAAQQAKAQAEEVARVRGVPVSPLINQRVAEAALALSAANQAVAANPAGAAPKQPLVRTTGATQGQPKKTPRAVPMGYGDSFSLSP